MLEILIMALFKSKESYLGVDIGTASIKLVELAPWSGKPRLVTYGYVDIVTDIIHSKSAENQIKIVNSLKKLLNQAQTNSNLAIAALPTYSVFNSIISLPEMSPKDLSSAVKWEAKKYIPMPLEEMILDWKVIKDEAAQGVQVQAQPDLNKGKRKGKAGFLNLKFGAKKPEGSKAEVELSNKGRGGDIRILVTAAPKNLVGRYLEIFKQAGLKLLSLETEAFALARSLISNDLSTVMIVDIGSITTDICVIEKGIPILNRSIDIGGLTITKGIAGSLNVNLERAEQFKRDFGVSVNQDDSQKGINKTIANSLSPIINEIKYVFDLFHNQSSRPIEKIVLSGGSAFLPNLPDYFSQLFNKPTIIGNPWDKVVYPEELKTVLDEVGTRLAVAIGLAMRDIK